MALTNCCYNQAGDRFATSSYDRSVRIFSTPSLASPPSDPHTSLPPPLLTLTQHTSLVYQLTYNLPFSDKLLTCSLDRTARLWDAMTGKSLYALVGHEGEVVAGCFDSASSRITTGGMDGMAVVWDVRTGLEATRMNAHEDGVPIVEFARSFSQSGSLGGNKNDFLLTAGMDGGVRVWDLRNATDPLWDWALDAEASVTAAGWVGETSKVVAGGTDGTVRVWDSLNGTEIGVVRDTGVEVLSVTASLDGSLVASAASDGIAKVYDVSSLRLRHILKGNACEVNKLVFSPPGERLLTAGNDGTVRLWDVTEGKCLQVRF
ncbi:hypothetical protein HDU93_004158 [Gonapodya sp. JEL0774]|nr:hypothetical protein HDU93_004158 [Gonapodya sp. JEL0774]